MRRTVVPRGMRIAALVLLGSLAWTSALAQTPSSAPLPVLATIKAIRALSQDEGARGYPVRVRAIVTHVDENSDTGLIIHDGEFGQFVIPPADVAKVPAWKELQRGDRIEIEGRTV